MKYLAFLIFILIIFKISFSQTQFDNFFQALINSNDNITSFIDPDELSRASRLKINYIDVNNKFLISYDIDENIKKEIIEKNIEYKINTLEKDEDYSKVQFNVQALNYTKYFYFKAGKYISPSTYYSRNWTTDTSKYFIFKISEPKYFNEYCIKKLDEFVDKTADMLEYTNDEKQLLETKKIYYILCKDENEIKTVSGFDTRGIYITAFDEVITTYSTHYHELSHLLMNYKLKNLSLYTLPFFMEGFAVAVGGRGGLAPRVVMDIGLYLQVKGLLNYDSIITNDGFYNEDASLTYPLAGLYNLFLINYLGIEKYLELYKKVNGDLMFLENIKRSDLYLPDKKDFINFLEKYKNDRSITIEKCLKPCNCPGYMTFPENPDPCIHFDEENSYLNLYPVVDSMNNNYTSKIFYEITRKAYNKEVYLFKFDTNSIKLYNCYSNELIASYDKNFSMETDLRYINPYYNPLIIIDGKDHKVGSIHYYFYIIKSVFDINFKKSKD